jgi:guanylate kinase
MEDVILHHKQEFQTLLQDYHVSDKARHLLSQMPLVILQGITGSGRNAIISYMVEHMPYHQIVSDTTRPPKLRDGKMERNGVQYFFRTEEEMLEELRQGLFLEAELIHDQQVSGTSIRELERAHESGKVPINEVARKGVENIRHAKPDTHFFFIVPPSYDEWMRRLTSREAMTDVELENRKQSAVLELTEALDPKSNFIFVVNHELEQAAREIATATTEGIDQERQAEGREVARGLLRQLAS